MKLAVITEDGKTVSQHFGRAPYYKVLTIENDQIIQRELRNKLGHNQFSGEQHSHEDHQPGQPHGHDQASHDKHSRMAEAISDCGALLCGGMGMGAYESMRRLNIRPLATDLREIDAAALAYVNGTMVDRTDRLH